VNKVLLTGRLTRDPEMRSLASGKAVTQFSIATNEYIGQGKEKAEYQYKGKVYRAGGLKIARRRTVALPGLSTHCVLSTAAAR
jgi:hypothetical protein